MKLLIVGYGKMGRLVEELAPAHGCEIADRIDVGSGNWAAAADVAIDFSTADALRANFPRYVERKLPVGDRHDRLVGAGSRVAGAGRARGAGGRGVGELFDRREPLSARRCRGRSPVRAARRVRRLDP